VLVLRVAAHHVPTVKPLDEVRDQIREELTFERAQELAEEAAQGFLAALEQGGDPAEIATARGGIWMPAAWIERTDAAVPTEVLSAAFAMPKATAAAPLREITAVGNGGQAVIVLTGVEAGEPSSMTQTERDQQQEQLAEQAARAELAAYVGNVRDAASVRIPEDILNPPLF
jgi:peptidyl-prolyl cis-trans isomerase D